MMWIRRVFVALPVAMAAGLVFAVSLFVLRGQHEIYWAQVVGFGLTTLIVEIYNHAKGRRPRAAVRRSPLASAVSGAMVGALVFTANGLFGGAGAGWTVADWAWAVTLGVVLGGAHFWLVVRVRNLIVAPASALA